MLIIPLSNTELVAYVDDDDFDRTICFNWIAEFRKNTIYVSSNLGKGKDAPRIRLHRFILKLTDPLIKIDHKNQNGLDCTKGNLRIATVKQNAANCSKVNRTTGFRGVYPHHSGSNFLARIRDELGRKLHLGMFDTKEQAAMAYDIAAIKYHGEFATLNFPDRWSTLEKFKLEK